MEELRFSEYCANCRKSLAEQETLLFVEKEVGRCFCCEECIQEYFQPTVQFMEEELRKLRPESDLSEDESQRLGHLRGLSLEEPDEVWLEQTETGERMFSFIGHFRHGEERISYVTVCLAIEGVPSFVFLGFATREEDLVDEYRRGVDLRVSDASAASEPDEESRQSGEEEEYADAAALGAEGEAAGQEPLAEEVVGNASVLERLYGEMRQPTDIAREDFPKFDTFIDATLDDPDEIWRFIDGDGNEWCTFISRQALDSGEDEQPYDEITMVVVCEPVLEPDQAGSRDKGFELVFAFPTIDPGLVQHFRKGVSAWNQSGQKALRTWRAGGRAA